MSFTYLVCAWESLCYDATQQLSRECPVNASYDTNVVHKNNLQISLGSKLTTANNIKA